MVLFNHIFIFSMNIDSLISEAEKNKEIIEIRKNFKWTSIFSEWKTIKEDYTSKFWKKNIVLFQVGNFYETYFEDAYIYSKLLNSSYTSKSKKDPFAAPMSWSPIFVLDVKIEKLVEFGFTVIVVSETGKNNKKWFNRWVTATYTPGTFLKDNNSKDGNYVIFIDEENSKCALIDIFVWDIVLAEYEREEDLDWILLKYIPKDILSSNWSKWIVYSALSDYDTFLSERWIVLSNIKYNKALVNCLNYCEKIKGTKLDFLKEPIFSWIVKDRFCINQTTINNLEIINHIWGNEFSLLWFMDKTITPMWWRLLKSFIMQPFSNLDKIRSIGDDVERFINKKDELLLSKDLLLKCYDLERLSSKMHFSNFSPLDVIQIKKSLENISELKQYLDKSNVEKIMEWFSLSDTDITEINNIHLKINTEFEDTPSADVSEWRVFRKWLNKELDTYIMLIENKKEALDKCLLNAVNLKWFPDSLKKKLKVAEKKTWFYFELKKDWVDTKYISELNSILVYQPPTKVSYRFLSEELKELYEKSLVAEEKRKNLEFSMFELFRMELCSHSEVLRKVAIGMAYLDYSSSLATLSLEHKYIRPTIDEDNDTIIVGWRHPVIENNVSNYVPNDIFLKDQKFKLLTWPNMWGKSVYLKMIWNISLMAQIWSFIPAEYAKLWIVDNIFVRAGSWDDSSRNQSTFFLEMYETAEILNSFTPKSLILIDELWRGTDSLDGSSLALAISDKIIWMDSRCIFSTHYHSLVKMIWEYKTAGNSYVSVEKDKQGQLIFTHKVKDWIPPENKSYGIEIAEIAGIDKDIINLAMKLKNKTLET